MKEAFAQSVNLENEHPFGWLGSLGEGLTFLVVPLFEIAGVLLVIWFILGAFDILMSGGSKEKIAEGQGKITHAIVGFVMLIMAFFIIQFIPEFLGLKGYTLIGK